MVQETIKIKGMHCGSCVNLIETELSSLSGVKDVKVILAQNIANIEYDANEVNLEKIKAEITKLGFLTGDDEEDKKKDKKKGNTFTQGLMYGLIPHIGCIAFIIGSILGVTVLMNFFKPLLMNRYFFHALIGISLGFATLSSGLYLRKQGLFSWEGARKKWKYLLVMYGSTVGINLVLFLLIFPLLANVSLGSPTGAIIGVSGEESMIKLKVDIPCPGHAPLISNELKTITGVSNVQFSFPNNFEVSYDLLQTSKEKMLSLDVFDEYPATVISEEVSELAQTVPKTQLADGNKGGCCGGTGGCASN